jgi:hypothetical protein
MKGTTNAKLKKGTTNANLIKGTTYVKMRGTVDQINYNNEKWNNNR